MAEGPKRQAAKDGTSSLAAVYTALMTETPPTKPPLSPLREHLKLSPLRRRHRSARRRGLRAHRLRYA